MNFSNYDTGDHVTSTDEVEELAGKLHQFITDGRGTKYELIIEPTSRGCIISYMKQRDCGGFGEKIFECHQSNLLNAIEKTLEVLADLQEKGFIECEDRTTYKLTKKILGKAHILPKDCFLYTDTAEVTLFGTQHQVITGHSEQV